ncbi:MAG: hypothetical protein ACLT9P_07685 [Evtepia gabavorous]
MDSILIKTLAAVILGFVISAVLGKYLVPALRRWKAGQAIKEDGPTWHMSKQGTPTMGGLMFIAAVAIVVLVLNGPAILSGDLTSVFVLLFALVFGLIGFIDDYAKIKKKENTGPERQPEISAPAGGGHSCSLCCCATAESCPPTSMSPSLGWSGSCPGWCT